MRIGVFTQTAVHPRATLAGVVSEIKSLESQGFAFVSIPNVFGLDAMTVAAVAGRETTQIELTTGVVPSPPRHPTAIAQQALTVQAACDGRFTLGIGLSHKLVIEGMFGLSYAQPAKQMREYLNVLTPLLRGEPASFDGDFYRVHADISVEGAGTVPLLA